MKKLLILALFIATTAWATGPVISAVVATPQAGGQSITFTWTTDIASSSIVVYGFDDTWGGSTYNVPVTSATGVTSHSLNVPSLIPGRGYTYYVASCAAGVCNSSATLSVSTLSPPAGSLTVGSNPNCDTHVWPGRDWYCQLTLYILTGTRDYQNITVSGFPAGSTVTFPTVAPLGLSCCSQTSTTALMFDVGSMAIKISVPATATPGAYTIAFDTTTGNPGGNPPTTHQTWAMTVDSGTPLTPGTPSSYPAIPDKATWESNMTTYGQMWCRNDYDNSNIIGPNDNANLCGIGAENCSWYYDGQWIYYRIQDYTKNTAWNQCALNARQVYRDNYVDTASPVGAIGQGWRVFADGLGNDFLRNADATSQGAELGLAANSAYSNFGANDFLITNQATRETAYKIRQYVWSAKLGTSYPSQLQASVDMGLGILDQSCISQTNQAGVQPFMLGLMMDSLWYYYDQVSKDQRIPVYAKACADWMWANAWVAGKNAFYYNSASFATSTDSSNCNCTGASDLRDLNLLISTPWARIFAFTGNATYQTNGDTIWDQGVLHAAISFNGKIFSQNYRSSFDYVTYRSAPATQTVTVSPSTATIPVLGTQQFSGTPTGGTWSATGCAGTIGSSSGFFAASTPEVCTVKDTVITNSGTGTVTVQPFTVAPTSVSLNVGATQQFSSNFSSSWAATCGSITSSGLYTAPSTNGTCTITATAVNGGTTATATATISGQTTLIPLVISPASWTATTTISTPITKVFTASNIGSGSVTPTVTLSGSGTFTISANTCTGAVSGGGNCTVTIQFTSPTVGSFSGNLHITDTAGGNVNLPLNVSIPSGTVVTVSPLDVTIPVLGTQQFSATTSNGSTVTWSRICPTTSAGGITSVGVFTAPAAADLCTVTATATDGSGSSGTASASVVLVSVNPVAVTLQINSIQQFTANVLSAWSASCGTISGSGKYTAFSSPATCTITATATNGGATGTATVTVVNPPPGTQGGKFHGKGNPHKFN